MFMSLKILWLYKYIPTCDYDHHLHMSYAKFVSFTPGVTLKAYGPDIHLGYPRVCLKPYGMHTLEDLHKIYPFDVVIVNTKSRCFGYYNPKKNDARDCWLPSDFSQWTKTPKIMIEEDAHYEKDFILQKKQGLRYLK